MTIDYTRRSSTSIGDCRPKSKLVECSRNGMPDAPIIFLHGFLGFREDWDPVRDFLHPLAMSGTALDLPGHGENTQYTQAPDFSALLRDLDAQRTVLGYERWHLVGYSMGGRIALHYALKYPEHVASLTLISATPGIEDEHERIQRRIKDEEWADKLRSMPRADFLDEWYRQSVFGSLQRNPVLLDAILSQRQGGDAERLAQALVAWGQGTVPAVWNRLHELTMPVQWLVGEQDDRYVAITPRLKDLLPEARIVIVPGAGHTVHLEQPEAVATALCDQIGGAAPPGPH